MQVVIDTHTRLILRDQLPVFIEKQNRARVYDYLDPVGVLQDAARARGWVYEDQPPV